MWGNPRGKRELNSSIEIKDIAKKIYVNQVIKGHEYYNRFTIFQVNILDSITIIKKNDVCDHRR